MARVLVVEHDLAVVDALTEACESLGHSVERALSGAAAIRTATDHRPEAVIVGWKLPDVPAHTLCGWLSALHSKLPMVALIDQADAATESQARECGIVGILPMPIERDAVERAIAQALGTGEESTGAARRQAGQPMVFVTSEGWIRLTLPPHGDEPKQVVVIHPDDAEAVIARLQEASTKLLARRAPDAGQRATSRPAKQDAAKQQSDRGFWRRYR